MIAPIAILPTAPLATAVTTPWATETSGTHPAFAGVLHSVTEEASPYNAFHRAPVTNTQGPARPAPKNEAEADDASNVPAPIAKPGAEGLPAADTPIVVSPAEPTNVQAAPADASSSDAQSLAQPKAPNHAGALPVSLPTPVRPARAASKTTVAGETPAAPFSAALIAQNIDIQAAKGQPAAQGPGSAVNAAATTPETASAPPTANKTPAVELKVRFNNGDSATVAPPPPSPLPVAPNPGIAPDLPKAHAPEMVPVVSPHAEAATAPAVETSMPQPEQRFARAESAVPAAPVRMQAELPETANPAPAVRSLSLEFTPDGAQDIRLRLTEHAGDIHIALHSTDTAFAGRLGEGVHDLVGALSHAGYDAQQWTPDHDRRNPQQQQQEQSPTPRRNSAGGNSFDDIVNESKKENA